MALTEKVEEIKGISWGLVPLFLFLVAAAFVGFFVVLITRADAYIWLIGLLAAGCMGAGIVYFAIETRSEREGLEEALADGKNPFATDRELAQTLARDVDGTKDVGMPLLAERHLEHLIQGLALGYFISRSSPATLGLPAQIKERVHASILRHAQEQDVDPSSNAALWGWLVKEGLLT